MTEAPRRAALISYEDLRRSAVLYSNLRSGSNLLKTTLRSVGGFFAPDELFNQASRSQGALMFHEFLEQPGTDLAALLSRPEETLPEYFRAFFASAPRDGPILIDIKYPQAYALGADYFLHVPTVLRMLVSWRFPVIHLVRRDVVAQAISHLVALRTGTFVKLRKDGQDPAREDKETFWLDPVEVLKMARARHWAVREAHRNLETLDARHMVMIYEDIAGPDWASHYRRLFQFLDLYREFPAQYTPATLQQNSAGRVANIEEVMRYIATQAPELVYSYLGG